MSAIHEALAMIAQYRTQHGADPEAIHVSEAQWKALKTDLDASFNMVLSPGGMDQLAGVRIKVLPEQPGLFKRPVYLEQYRHLKVVEMLTGKRLPYDQYGVVVIDTAQKPAPL